MLHLICTISGLVLLLRLRLLTYNYNTKRYRGLVCIGGSYYSLVTILTIDWTLPTSWTFSCYHDMSDAFEQPLYFKQVVKKNTQIFFLSLFNNVKITWEHLLLREILFIYILYDLLSKYISHVWGLFRLWKPIHNNLFYVCLWWKCVLLQNQVICTDNIITTHIHQMMRRCSLLQITLLIIARITGKEMCR